MNRNGKRLLSGMLALLVFIAGGSYLIYYRDLEALKNISADITNLSEHVEGEIIVLLPDPYPFSTTAESGTIDFTSTQYQGELDDIRAQAGQLLQQKLNDSTLTIESDVIFDERTVEFSQERMFRMQKIDEEQMAPNPGRIVYSKVKSAVNTTEDMLLALQNDPDILYAQANFIYRPPTNTESTIFTPQSFNAENADSLWNIFDNSSNAGMDANTVWDSGITGKGKVIAVIDTGIDLDHPDLQANIWHNPGETDCANGVDDDGNGYIDDCNGWDFGDNDNDPSANNFHGTHTAGIIAAQKNDSGVVGVAPDAKIMPLKIFPDVGYADTSVLLNAIEYAWRNNADIISTSLGREDQCSDVEGQAIARALEAGVVVVASSGNNDPAHNMYVPFPNAPSICDGVISTGAINRQKQLASYSNYYQNMVDVVAPGGESGDAILSTTLNGGYSQSSGTSMAAPHVAGMAALLLEKNPTFTPTEVGTYLCDGSADLGPGGRDTFYGCGMLRASTIITQANATAPVISSGAWNPNPVQADPWISTLTFSVCDADNDLANGEVQVFQAGSTTPFLGSHLPWNDSPPVPDVPDCSSPEPYEIPIDFTDVADGQYCVDIRVTDGSGNVSNTLVNVCLTKASTFGNSLNVSPETLILEIGETPQQITVTGGSSYSYLILDDGTGIGKQNCPDGTSGICQLSAPFNTGSAVVMITSGTDVALVDINVASSPPPPPDPGNSNLQVQKTSNKSTVVSGDTVQYTITYSNSGSTNLTNVTLTDAFDSSQLSIDQVPSNCTDQPGQITCTIGALAVGQGGSLTYTATVQ